MRTIEVNPATLAAGAKGVAVGLLGGRALGPNVLPQHLSINEAAEMGRVTVQCIRNMIEDGRLVAYKFGGHKVLIETASFVSLFVPIEPQNPAPGQESEQEADGASEDS